MDCSKKGVEYKVNVWDYCIPDSITTHTILKQKKYFLNLKATKTIVNTISGPVNLIERTGKASFILPIGTKFLIKDTLFSPRSRRNLLSFNDIYSHGYDI